MTTVEFIVKFVEALEIENTSDVNLETKFRDLDEWSSLSALSLMAMADEEFGFELDSESLSKAQTVEDLYNILTGR